MGLRERFRMTGYARTPFDSDDGPGFEVLAVFVILLIVVGVVMFA